MQEQGFNPDKLLEENLFLKNNLNEYKRFLLLFSEVGDSMSSILDIDGLIAFFVNKLAEIFKVNRVSFMLIDENRQELLLKASEGLGVNRNEVKLKIGEAFGGWVAKNGNPLLVKDVETEYPELSKNRISRYLTRSFIILPVKVEEKIIGVLSLTDKKDSGIFTDDDLHILTLMGRSLALHIENIRLLEKNNILSTQDPLTNLFNHRFFQEQLLEEISRAERYRRSLSLVMLDIDNLSIYNQNYGYSVGDVILKEVATLIKENTRKIDFVSRFGSEEFMIILPEIRLKDAVFVGEKIREKISARIFAQDRTSSLEMLKITVSVGAAEHRTGLTNEELISRVTQALKEAKEKGKNCVCAFK